MTGGTGFYLHPESSLHDTGWGHPEHQGRLRALASAVGRDLLALHGNVHQQEPADAVRDDLLRVHTEAHVAVVEEACRRAQSGETVVSIDPDTRVSGASWGAPLGAPGV